MFALCTASIITLTASTLPIFIAQKVDFHKEKTKSSFDGILNFLNHAALLCSATDNATYTLKEMLSQPDVT